MEAHFHLSPLIEPIGRKPYLKKWIDHKSAQNGYADKYSSYQFDDIYRFLFQILEQHNLELAYEFRFTVEAAGSVPFNERQDQLHRALKKAKNKAYEPLKKLLQEIQLELNLDYDLQASSLAIKRSITEELIDDSGEFEETVFPSLDEISIPDPTNHQIPLSLHNWNKNSQESLDINGKDPLTDEKEKLSTANLKDIKVLNSQTDQTNKRINIHDEKGFLNHIPENLDDLSTSQNNKKVLKPLPLPEGKIQVKNDQDKEAASQNKPDHASVKVHTPVFKKGVFETGALQAKNNTARHLPTTENPLGEKELSGSNKSDSSENIKESKTESLDSLIEHDVASETTWQNETIKDFFPLPVQSTDPVLEQEEVIPEEKDLKKDKSGKISSEQSEDITTQETIIKQLKAPSLPVNMRPLELQPLTEEKQPLKDNILGSSSPKPKKPVKSPTKIESEPGKSAIEQNNQNSLNTGESLKQSKFPVDEGSYKNNEISSVKSDPAENVQDKQFKSIDSPITHESVFKETLRNETINDFSPLPTQSATPGFKQELKPPAEPVSEREESASFSEKHSKGLEGQESTHLTAKASTHPVNRELIEKGSFSKEKPSLIDRNIGPATLKPKKPAKLSDRATIANTEHSSSSIEQNIQEFEETDGTAKQTQHIFQQSESLKSHGAAKREESQVDQLEEETEEAGEASKHKSLSAGTTSQETRSLDFFHSKSMKSSLFQKNEKTTLKDKSRGTPEDISPGEEEHYPNLSLRSAKRRSLPFKPRKQESPESEQTVLEKTTNDDQEHPRKIRHNLSGFKLPITRDQQSEQELGNVNANAFEDSEKDEKKKEKENRQSVIASEVLSQHHNLNIYRVNKRNETNGLGEGMASNKKTIQAVSPPPPLYNFKFELKKPIIDRRFEHFDSSSSLVITKDSIDRRTETITAKKHFLSGSTTWNYFKKKDFHPFYQDTTSLVIQKDSIDHRIYNIALPSKHALDTSSSDLETFKAFDAFYDESKNTDANDIRSNSSFSTSDNMESYSFHDSLAEVKNAQEFHKKQRNDLYRKSLNRLNNREGIFFDYKAGKISIDHSDKHEIEKWVRSQQSESIEIYRAYSEAVMYLEFDRLKSIQDMVRSKLKNNDFPSQRVREIFNRLKEKSSALELNRNSLIAILKRQDYVNINTESLASSISFSNSYSRYRAWRNTVESPKIEIRAVDSTKRESIFSFNAFQQRFSYSNSPKINVRSSSDYQFKHTLPVFDKLYDWRKNQS